MSKDENEKNSSSSASPNDSPKKSFNTVADDVQLGVSKYLSFKDLAKLTSGSKANQTLFSPLLADVKSVLPLLKAVVEANPAALKTLLASNPQLLFKKGEVTDPAGQRYYNVSPYQLMTFLADSQMKRQIMALVEPVMDETMQQTRLAQYAEIDCGGADLIKMDRDPVLLPFEDIQRYHYQYFNRYTESTSPEGFTLPLLENPDGIIYYKDPNGFAHLYYADQAKKSVTEVEYKVKSEAESEAEQVALDEFLESFNDMEDNSSCRSSNKVHNLIAKMLCHPETKQPIVLFRKGIQYDDVKGERFCDYRIDFNRYYNTNRKALRLNAANQEEEGDKAWLELGERQKERLCRLQLICQKGLFFSPLPDLRNVINLRTFDFTLDFSVYSITNASNPYPHPGKDGVKPKVFVDGHFTAGLGSRFTLYKGFDYDYGMAIDGSAQGAGCCFHLVAISQLDKQDNDAVAELVTQQALQSRPNGRN